MLFAGNRRNLLVDFFTKYRTVVEEKAPAAEPGQPCPWRRRLAFYLPLGYHGKGQKTSEKNP
jgi:hypothetical protein